MISDASMAVDLVLVASNSLPFGTASPRHSHGQNLGSPSE